MPKELTLTQQKHTCTNELTQNNSKKLNITHNITAEKLNLTNKKLLGLFICVCIALCTTVAHNTHTAPDNFSSTPDNIITAPMMSI